MAELLLATHNAGKVGELRAILSGVPITIKSLLDYPDIPEVEEDGKTLEENALKKARETFLATGIPSLSDDTGLEVFSLDLRPGVISARYAGEKATYADNYRKLLGELAGYQRDRRKARFRCVSVFIAEGVEKVAVGACHGTIIEAPAGTGGFGYDPVFVPDGYSQTFAELSPEIKNTISHRAKAFQKMAEYLKEYFRCS
jgi:XTP/dITP diphosphohydrolase